MIRDLFVRFRRSNAFVYALFVACAFWSSCHFFLGFDPSWALGNLLLSLEASFASCMILDIQFKMGTEDRRIWQRIERELLDVAEDVEELDEDH